MITRLRNVAVAALLVLVGSVSTGGPPASAACAWMNHNSYTTGQYIHYYVHGIQHGNFPGQGSFVAYSGGRQTAASPFYYINQVVYGSFARFSGSTTQTNVWVQATAHILGEDLDESRHTETNFSNATWSICRNG